MGNSDLSCLATEHPWVTLTCSLWPQLADQFCNAIGVLQQCGPPASFSNIQTAINKDQPANPTEGKPASGLLVYFTLELLRDSTCCFFLQMLLFEMLLEVLFVAPEILYYSLIA